MRSESKWLIKKEGRILWIPILWILLSLLETIGVLFLGVESDSLLFHLGNNLPVFAFLWPLIALQEVVNSQGGEIYLVYRRSSWYWVFYVGILVLTYIVLAVMVTAVCMSLFNLSSPGFLLRIASLSFVYGWLGFFLIAWTRDMLWSTFIALVLFIALNYSKILDSLWWNLHKFPLKAYLEVLPWELVANAAWLGIVLIAFGSMGFRRQLSLG